MSSNLVSPSEQIALNNEWISASLTHIEQAKLLLNSADEDELKRGQTNLVFNYRSAAPNSYCIGQIKWRLELDDPSDDLERTVKLFAKMLHDTRKYDVLADTYWAHLVAFVSVILCGSVPDWLAACQTDLSSYLHRKKRLLPWEINLGYQSALVLALHSGEFPECWPRFISDSTDRAGLKRIHQNIITYEQLFRAAQNRNWHNLAATIKEVNSNYQKRGSNESSHADVFGDGPYNNQSIDFIAAAILRTVQREPDFPHMQISTPHIWKWQDRDLSHLLPSAEL